MPLQQAAVAPPLFPQTSEASIVISLCHSLSAVVSSGRYEVVQTRVAGLGVCFRNDNPSFVSVQYISRQCV